MIENYLDGAEGFPGNFQLILLFMRSLICFAKIAIIIDMWQVRSVSKGRVIMLGWTFLVAETALVRIVSYVSKIFGVLEKPFYCLGDFQVGIIRLLWCSLGWISRFQKFHSSHVDILILSLILTLLFLSLFLSYT